MLDVYMKMRYLRKGKSIGAGEGRRDLTTDALVTLVTVLMFLI
jgi:hypothetical protein